jgi:hypothetical protein
MTGTGEAAALQIPDVATILVGTHGDRRSEHRSVRSHALPNGSRPTSSIASARGPSSPTAAPSASPGRRHGRSPPSPSSSATTCRVVGYYAPTGSLPASCGSSPAGSAPNGRARDVPRAVVASARIPGRRAGGRGAITCRWNAAPEDAVRPSTATAVNARVTP